VKWDTSVPYTSEQEEGERQGSSEAVGVRGVVVLIVAARLVFVSRHLTSSSLGQANCSP